MIGLGAGPYIQGGSVFPIILFVGAGVVVIGIYALPNLRRYLDRRRFLPERRSQLLLNGGKTVRDRMREVGLAVHEGLVGPAPRAGLLGFVHLRPIEDGDCCSRCRGRRYELNEVVECPATESLPPRYDYARPGKFCDICGDGSPAYRSSALDRAAVLRFGYGENLFDVLDRLDKDWTPSDDPEALDAEIREFEARLNQARLKKARLQYLTGRGRSEEPYRGDGRALPPATEDP